MKPTILKKLITIKCKSQTEKKLFEQTLKIIADMEGVEMKNTRVPVGGGFPFSRRDF